MVGKALGFAAQAAPWLVVSGLAYAAAFIKPSVDPLPLPQPLKEPRDLFYDVAVDAEGDYWFAGNTGTVLEAGKRREDWQRHDLGTTANLQGIAVSPEGRVVVVGNDGAMFSKAAGADWTSARLPVSDLAGKLIDVAWIDGAFWAVGEMGAVFTAPPAADSWQNLSIDGDIALNDIVQAPDGDLWMAAEFGSLYHSTDHGMSWASQELGPESLRSLAFGDDKVVVVGNQGAIYVSLDNGDSWSPASKISDEHLYDVTFDGRNWYATGNAGALLSSEDAMQWRIDEPDGFGSGFHVRLLPTDEGIVVAGSTIGLLSSDEWAVWPPEGIAQ